MYHFPNLRFLANPYNDIGFLAPPLGYYFIFSYSAAGFLTVSSIERIVQAALNINE